MIPQRNISLLSNRLAAGGGRRIREDVLERDYCLAWFLSALSESELRQVFAFKGGTALKRCYFSDYRFSEDLDFTSRQQLAFEQIRDHLERVYAIAHENSGITFVFDRQDRQTDANSYTFYLRYVGPLPAGNDVKVDITINERLTFPLRDRLILRGYEEFADLPEARFIDAYSLEEIAAEKTVALADPARNEPRDLYDLWYLTSDGRDRNGSFDSCDLREIGISRQILPRTPTGNCAERSATRGAVDQKTRPPDGFAAAVRAGVQSIAQDTSPGRLALNRVARSSK